MVLDKFLEQVSSALDKMVTLDIVTAVGPLTYDSAKNTYSSAEPAKIMHTRLDLLLGDAKTQIDEEFVTGRYQVLREYHAAREKLGHELLRGNLEVLKQLFDLALHFKEKQ